MIFDPDTHFHHHLGKKQACWVCDEAYEICSECPVIQACFEEGRERRESFMIRAGMLWYNGVPRDLRKRKR